MDVSEFRPQRQLLVPPGEIELFARDMTATIATDVPLATIQATLAEVGQWLPVDGDPTLAVGRLVEMNSTGPLRLGYGAWRDLLLGCQFTNGRGELITAGGRAVKNVAGYDLTKLMVGQQGELGAINTITTRTYRRPDGAILARFEPEVRVLNRLLATAIRPQWAMLTSSDLLCGYLGDAASLDFWYDALQRWPEPAPREVVRRTLAEDMAERARIFRWPAGELAFRASVPPMRIAAFVERAGLNQWAADAAFGIVVGVMADAGRIREAAAAVGGTVVGEALGSRTSALLERVKLAFRS